MTNKNGLILKSPKLNGAIVESILLLLSIKEYFILDLLSELKKRLPYFKSQKFKKYLVYLVDYELISYNGQRRIYQIEYNGHDLFNKISIERKRVNMTNSEEISITIEREYK
ncbi:MAG TPA: hypothetical protein VN704_10365 [Verrucomicrobiae bacterium]|nr:hypothetical protein [Verrucomicrobiae bacterium]